MRTPTKTLERKLLKSGYGCVIGVDEVGVGCLAGPVVVCAVRFAKDFYINDRLTRLGREKFEGLRESKLLSTSRRELFAEELLKEKKLTYAIALCYPKKIDAVNIYQATREAMRRAIKKLTTNNSQLMTKTIILVDGNKKIKKIKFDQRAIVKGDQKIFTIACASIIAKVYRDKMMKRYAKQFPAYGFEQHKGYSTKTHQDALNQYGPCPIHRRSFRLIY